MNNNENNNLQFNNQLNSQNKNVQSMNDFEQQINNQSINGYSNINNNQNTTLLQQNNIYSQNNQTILKFIKTNKKKIIILIIVLVIIFLVLGIFSKGSNGNNGYTAGIGEVLEINEKYQMLNIKVITSPEKYTNNDHLLCNGDYVRIKVSVKNPTTTDLQFGLIQLDLVDDTKNKLYTSNYFCTLEESILSKTIASGDTTEGYIYFYSSLNETRGNYTTDYNKINNIKYLKVSVISEQHKKNNTYFDFTYEDYYLELK